MTTHTDWSNWLGNQTARPQRVVDATSVGDVIDALQWARQHRMAVRPMGGSGAWSPLIPCDGLLLGTRGLRRVRHIDHRRQRITVETGALLSEVVEVAALNGLSIESPAMYMGLTLGGLIATGSHGTGRHCATLGDAVVGFELVLANGDVMTVDEPGSELWRAVITNVGALGILTAVTLQCEPLYNVHEVHERVPSAEVAALLPSMLKEFEFVSAFWHPGHEIAVLKLGNRSALPPVPVRGRVHPTLREKTTAWLGPLIGMIPPGNPLFARGMAACVTYFIGQGSRVISEPYFSHYQQVYPRCISSEFAVPVEHTQDAWSWAHQRLSQYARAGVRPVNLVMHARFGRASDALISSSAGRASCFLECLSMKGNPHRDLFEGEFDTTMRTRFAGRPHWGKDINNPWALAATHGDNLTRFLDIRAELDPEQRMLNPWLRDDVFALGRRRAASRPTVALQTAGSGQAAE